MRRSSAKRSRMPPFTMSFRCIAPSSRPFLVDGERRAAGLGDPIRDALKLARRQHRPRGFRYAPRPRRRRPLRIETPSVSTPLIRVCALKGTKCALSSFMSRPRMPYFSLASTTIERPSGVSSASEESCAASASSRASMPASGDELRRLPVAERDRSGLVEKQRIDVACRLHRSARHGKDVEAHQPIHAGDSDRRKKRSNRRRDKRDEERDKRKHRDGPAGIGGKAWDRRDGHHEDQCHSCKKDIQRDFVRRLLALRALHERDHAVKEGRALRRGDPYLDPVGDDNSAAGDGRAVAARFADDRARTSP